MTSLRRKCAYCGTPISAEEARQDVHCADPQAVQGTFCVATPTLNCYLLAVAWAEIHAMSEPRGARA
jgi:hypothetical protein